MASVFTEVRPESPASKTSFGPRFQRKFVIEAKHESDAYAILNARTGIEEGTVYESHQGDRPDPSCVCVSLGAVPITPVPTGGTGFFDAVADFGYVDSVRFTRSVSFMQTRRWIERTANSEPADYDRHGIPITNASDEPVDPPRTFLRIDKVLVIEWWKYFQSWAHAEAYCSAYDEKVNSAPYYSAPIECLFCLGIDPDESPINVTNLIQRPYKLTARFQFKPPKTVRGPTGSNITYGGWRDVFQNRGRRLKITSNSYRELRIDGNGAFVPFPAGSPISDPVFLTSNGFATIDRSFANFRDAEHYVPIDFNALGV